MTPEKTIEILDYLRATYPNISLEQITALELARRGIEKDIPKKARKYRTHFFCTNCNSRIKMYDQYCPQCGWKITVEE